MAAPSWARRGHKYHATPTVVDGLRFDSKAEARRYEQLQLLVRAGVIRDLQRQVPFPITVVNLETGELIPVGTWRADFVYVQVADGARVVEDSKGVRTETYKLKKRLIEAQYGIRITEV